jgi:hypothetical protein
MPLERRLEEAWRRLEAGGMLTSLERRLEEVWRRLEAGGMLTSWHT